MRATVITPDGSLLVSGSEDNTIRLWSLPDGKYLRDLMDLKINYNNVKGNSYEGKDVYGRTVTFTQPCGSPIPAGAVCTCNCVPGSITIPKDHSQQFNSYGYCTCDLICTCNTVCTCQSVGGGGILRDVLVSQLMDVHFIPFQGRYIIYRPLKRLAFVGNKALVNYLRDRAASLELFRKDPKIETFLHQVGFDEEILPSLVEESAETLPVMAVLLMTNRCNLACTYCYAAAGSHTPQDMPWATARTLIRTAFENARANGDSKFALSFHGGGEPTLNWSVLKKAVDYAQNLPLACDISLASNGVWSPSKRDFICENIDQVTLSFDGVKAVHDAQRPHRSGRGSFREVFETIRSLDTAAVNYGIRMTVLPNTIDRLHESVEFLCRETGVRAIQIEGSFTIERGIYADPSLEAGNRFIEQFIQAARIAAEQDIQVTYSGARPWVIAHAFCLAPTRALIATPKGRLVACFEATDEEHPYARDFTIGRVGHEDLNLDLKAKKPFLTVRSLEKILVDPVSVIGIAVATACPGPWYPAPLIPFDAISTGS